VANLTTSSDEDIAELARLTDEKNIAKLRNLGDTSIKGLNQTQVTELRRRAKTDLYFLAKGVLRYTKLSPNLHGSLCEWYHRNRSWRFKELLLARGHYKSTVRTEAHGIQCALPVDSEDWGVCYPETLGTNIRILIAHEVKETASKFLLAITGHFLSNPTLMALFPECVPTKRDQRINLSELELPRSERWGEATYTTMGVGGRSQGKHFNFLKLDDLIGDKARDSKVEMQAAKDWFDNIQSFFSSFTEDYLDLIGTRWAFDDLYDHVHNTYGKAMLKYIRGAEEIKIVDGKKVLVPVFPEQFSIESFAQLKLNKRIWSAQYANNPAAGGVLFQHTWKRWYTWINDKEIRVGTNIVYIDDLDIVILLDPAMSGLAGFVVTGMDSEGNIYILDAQKEEWTPPEVVTMLFKAVDKWHPRLVAIESVLFSGLFEHWLKDRMKLVGKFFRVEPITTLGQEKELRVLGLTNYYAAGQIYYNASQTLLVKEHDEFGATDDYHLLDSLAQGPKVWRRGVNSSRLRSNKEAYKTIIGPDPIGGY